MRVKAGKNGPVMREGARRRIDGVSGRDVAMIYPDEPVDVPSTRYYLRRIQMGDLVEVTTEDAAETKTKKTTAHGQEE